LYTADVVAIVAVPAAAAALSQNAGHHDSPAQNTCSFFCQLVCFTFLKKKKCLNLRSFKNKYFKKERKKNK